MQTALLRMAAIVSALVSVELASAQTTVKVLPAELAYKTIDYAGLHVSGMSVKSNDIQDTPFQELVFSCDVRNATMTPIQRYTVFVVAVDADKRPLFACNASSSMWSSLAPGGTSKENQRFFVERGTLEMVASYSVRFVVPRNAEGEPKTDAAPATVLQKPCPNSKCIKGMVTYKGIDGKTVEKKCPVCGGTGWAKATTK